MSSQENKNLPLESHILKPDKPIKIEQNKQYGIKIIWFLLFLSSLFNFYIIYLIFIGIKSYFKLYFS